MADKQWDVSFAERKRIEQRAAMKEALRKQYIKLITDPYAQSSGKQGLPFDPALQRWMSMKATQGDFFKPTPKNALFFWGGIVAPIIIFGWFLKRSKQEFERKCRNGEISYRDRRFKFN